MELDQTVHLPGSESPGSFPGSAFWREVTRPTSHRHSSRSRAGPPSPYNAQDHLPPNLQITAHHGTAPPRPSPRRPMRRTSVGATSAPPRLHRRVRRPCLAVVVSAVAAAAPPPRVIASALRPARSLPPPRAAAQLIRGRVPAHDLRDASLVRLVGWEGAWGTGRWGEREVMSPCGGDTGRGE